MNEMKIRMINRLQEIQDMIKDEQMLSYMNYSKFESTGDQYDAQYWYGFNTACSMISAELAFMDVFIRTCIIDGGEKDE